MGFIKSILFGFITTLLFLTLFFSGVFYMINLSLDYEVVKPKLTDFSKDLFSQAELQQDLTSNFYLIQKACLEIPSYNFSIQEDNFEIPCQIISNGTNQTYNYILEEFVNQTYYKDYNCSFIKCLEETKNPNFLISKQTKDYVSSKLYFLIFASFLLAGLTFLLIEKKSSFPIIVGIFLIFIGLPFLKLDSALSFIEDKLILNFISLFLTKSYAVFAKFLFFGILLIITGIIWKVFLVGFKINKIANWFKEYKKKRQEKKSKKLEELKKKKSNSKKK
ncbi:hypothetical protein ACFLZF_00545 [Nanoarchaeota archaeon]